MTTSLVCLGILLLAAAGIVTLWGTAVRQHQRRLDQLDVRIHVNGIRGKSSVTRLVAGVLREGGFVTVAKTTGSAARVIGPMGEETPIIRRGAPTINEQIDVVAAHVTSEVEALVIECMAVRPLYQKYSQDFMVRSDITIITNVREDHQEEMGETLEEIADSLSATIPTNGVLITAEDRPHLRQRLEGNAGPSAVASGARRPVDRQRRGHGGFRLRAVQGERGHRPRGGAPARHSSAACDRGHVEVRPGRRSRPSQVVPGSRQAGPLDSAVRGERPGKRHRLLQGRSPRTFRRTGRSSPS